MISLNSWKKVFLLCSFLAASLAHSQKPSILPDPTGDFSISRDVASVDVDIDFKFRKAPGSGIILDYDWTISDGTQFKGRPEFTHRFSKPGIYDVELILTGTVGSSKKILKKVEILPNSFPTADFYFSNKEILVGETVRFFSQAKDEDGNIQNREWILEEAKAPQGQPSLATGKDKVFNYTFSKAGEYVVRHLVTDTLGAKAESERTLVVLEENQLPELELTIPQSVQTNKPAQFHVKVADRDGKVVKTTWQIVGYPEVEFKGNSFEAVFMDERRNSLTVRAIDERGGTAKVTKIVIVENISGEPNVDVSIWPSKAQAGNPLSFIAQFDGAYKRLDEIQWNFGDGGTLNSKKLEVDYTFKKSGTYKVKVDFLFDQQKKLTKEIDVEVVDNVIIFTTPHQVVINNRNYIEVIPGQNTVVNFSAYESGGQIFSYGTPSWNLSNGNVTVVSTTSGGATLQGVSAGESTVSVTVDGVTSQNITVKVLGYVSDAVVTHKGRFVGGEFEDFCMYLNRSGSSTFVFDHDYDGETNYGSNSYCHPVHIPVGKKDLYFSAFNYYDPNERLSYLKSGIDSFSGRVGYLDLRGSYRLNIFPGDRRFFDWDQDFSITYWTWGTAYAGYSLAPYISGKVLMEPIIAGGSRGIRTYGGAGYKYLFGPGGTEFRRRWTHIAYTFVSSSRLLSLYSDGELIGAVTVPSGGLTSTDIMRFEAQVPYMAIDELRFWGKSLSSGEVASELFSPVSSTSSDILAAFNFDSENEQTSASGWSHSTTGVGSSTGPTVRVAPSLNVDTQVRPLMNETFETFVPNGEFGNTKVSLKIYPESFQETRSLSLEVNSCQHTCDQEGNVSTIKGKRVSPYVRISGNKEPYVPFPLVKIPFHAFSLTPAEIGKIKVAYFDQTSTSGTSYKVLEPRAVNLTEGTVTFDAAYNGVFWITVPSSMSALANLTNSDLKPSADSYGGFRTYYVDIPSSQSSYTVTAQGGGQDPHTVRCFGPTSSFYVWPISFPITISGLESGTTVCALYYSFYGGYDYYFSTHKYHDFSDMILIQR